MFNIGPLEILVVALVALVVVGPKRLPELGKTIGKGLREFRKAQDELRRSVDLTLDEPKPSFEERGPRPSRRPASRTTDVDEPDESPPAAHDDDGTEATGDAPEDAPEGARDDVMDDDARGPVSATEAGSADSRRDDRPA